MSGSTHLAILSNLEHRWVHLPLVQASFDSYDKAITGIDALELERKG